MTGCYRSTSQSDHTVEVGKVPALPAPMQGVPYCFSQGKPQPAEPEPGPSRCAVTKKFTPRTGQRISFGGGDGAFWVDRKKDLRWWMGSMATLDRPALRPVSDLAGGAEPGEEANPPRENCGPAPAILLAHPPVPTR